MEKISISQSSPAGLMPREIPHARERAKRLGWGLAAFIKTLPVPSSAPRRQHQSPAHSTPLRCVRYAAAPPAPRRWACASAPLLAHLPLWPQPRRNHVLHQSQVLHLRFGKHAAHVVDVAAGHAVVVEALDSVAAVLMRQPIVDGGIQRVALTATPQLVGTAEAESPFAGAGTHRQESVCGWVTGQVQRPSRLRRGAHLRLRRRGRACRRHRQPPRPFGAAPQGGGHGNRRHR